MVLSLISYKIAYDENPDVNKSDLNHESSIYEITVFGIKTYISLGKVDRSYINDHILFVRIYLLSGANENEKENENEHENETKPRTKKEKIQVDKIDEKDIVIIGQIGLYEIEFYSKNNKDIDHIVNNQDEIYLEKLGEPLFFLSCQQMIQTGKKVYPIIEPINESEKNNNELEKAIDLKRKNEIENILEQIDIDIEDLDDKIETNMELKISSKLQSNIEKQIQQILVHGYFLRKLPNYYNKLLPDENKEMAENNVKEYEKGSTSIKGTYNWISKYMKNTNYNIINISSDGDCFFHVIVEAFKQIGFNTTISILRAIVAKNISIQQFTENRKLVLEMILYIEKRTIEMKRIKLIINNDIKKQLKTTILSQKKRKQLIDECFQLIESYKKIEQEVSNAIEFKKEMFNTIAFEKIDSFENYKEFILTSDFFADTETILILEKELNMKVIVLSDYISDNNEIIRSCNTITNKMQHMDRLQPNYYIMTSKTNNQYQSISYKNRKIFEFSEIPYQIKLMIVQKCISTIGGIYNSINDFIEFQTKLGIVVCKEKLIQKKKFITKLKCKSIACKKKSKIPHSNSHSDCDSTLFDPLCHFLFYSKSVDMKPGMSCGDKITNKENYLDFIDLSGKINWRQKLDDSWIDIENPFSIDSLNYASVMHYYQGSKFKNGHPEFSKLFSLNSKSNISIDIKLCIAASSLSGKIINEKGIIEIIRPETILIDTDFYPFRNIVEREKAIHCKFLNNDEYKNILLSTKKSQLNHYIGNKLPEIAVSLMKVRSIL